MLIAVAVVTSLLGARALQLQGIDSDAYAAKAAELMTLQKSIPAYRGVITDRSGEVLAVSNPAVDITADPFAVATNGMLASSMSTRDRVKAASGPATIAQVLVANIGGDFDTYVSLLTKPKSRYVVLARQIPSAVYLTISDRLSALGYTGVYKEQNPVRQYPNGTLASNVLGFISKDTGEGGGGLEFALNANLAGIDGSQMYMTSPNGQIPTGTSTLVEAKNGINYTLTLDAGLQYIVERRLQEAVDTARAASGTAIVLNVKSGEVLSMANYPTYDSNDPGKASASDLGNRAVTDAYEPGSVQKVLTMSALLDTGTITPDTKLVVPASIMSGGRPIKDAFSHNDINLTARGVVANSSNIGTVMLTRKMDKTKLVEYLTSFGLGSKTGIGLPGEGTGSIPGATIADNVRDQISFGQGLSVTAIQEAAAVAAVVNKGVYVQPSIIKSATTSDGKAIELPAPTTRRVISEASSSMVLDMMESVVASKVGVNRFPIEGYRTAAKSGTAERVDPSCGCYNGYVASFIGVAPVEDPDLLVYVVLDRPQGQIQGSQVAAPVYKDIMKVALQRYGIPTSSQTAPTEPIEW